MDDRQFLDHYVASGPLEVDHRQINSEALGGGHAGSDETQPFV
jgi:hypothetical protein